MKSKRLPAFTLIEMLVVLLISGILSGFVYLSLVIVHDYYGTVSNRLSDGLNHQEIIYLLKSDVTNADWIVRENQDFVCRWQNGKQVRYRPFPKGIMRKQLTRLDTFLIGKNITTFTELKEDTTALVAGIQISSLQWKAPLILVKEYTAQSLFTWNDLMKVENGN